MKRLYNLDYLRGLAAFGIMIYHYFYELSDFNAGNFMGKLGVYGVVLFYILSGLTLYHVYSEKMKPTIAELMTFFKRRVFRIFPLLWLVTIATVFVRFQDPSFKLLFVNLSGLFGFIKWDAYIATGAWSIGNELVFYVFFPVFIFLLNKSKFGFTFFSSVLFLIFIYFTFYKLNSNIPLSEQWVNFVNPLNQVFIFLSGFLVGYLFKEKRLSNFTSLAILISGICLFVFFKASGDTINIVTGYNRLIFTASSILICLGFYKISFQLPSFIHKPLSLLGEASYSVYLIHPVIYSAVFLINESLNISQVVATYISIVITLIVSVIVYQYFEKYFMQLGRTNPERSLKKELSIK